LFWVQYSRPCDVVEHFYQFEYLGDFSKNICATFQLIWLTTVWVIWYERNVRVFHQKEESLQHLQDKIMLQSYWWLKANKINFVFNYHLWWLNLLACLGITLY